MAKTQNDQLKSPAKDQENRFLKNESLKPQIQQDQLGLNTQMAHAVNFPDHATPDSILQLQQRYGNNEVRRIIQREHTDNSVTDNQDNLSSNIAGEIQKARSGGQPLPADMMGHMESKFGKDLSNVRLHPDQKADEISRKIQAKAFTVGNDIFFRKGAYSPNSEQGRNTLMHELTHVVQQSSGAASNGPLKLGDPNDKYEKEAEVFAKSAEQQSQGVSGSTPDTVQRLSIAGIKTKIGGVLSKGGNQSNSSLSHGATPLSQTTAPPTPAPKPGLKPEELASVQKAGVLDQADWDSIPAEKQKLIFDLIKTDQALAQMLVAAFKASQWPKDDSGAEIIDANKLKIIVSKLNISLSDWSALKATYKKLLMDLKDKTYIQDLIALAKTNTWPKDGNDQDISDENSFKTITQDLGTSLNNWLSITDNTQRGFLLANGKKPFVKTLFNLALQSSWPKDGNDQFILDENIIKTITDTLKINLDKWQLISDKNQKSFLLKNSAQPYTVKLAEMALQGKWPKDGNDQDILNENLYKLITVNWSIALDKWLTIGEKKQRGFLLQNGTKPYAIPLLTMALQGKWPKDGSDQDILDGISFNMITKTWNITLDQWLSITDQPQRKFLLENGTKPYIVDLVSLAQSAKWPKDGSDQNILSDEKLSLMTKTLKISISNWMGLTDLNKRKFLLENGTKPYAIELAGMVIQGNWPKDGSDVLIFEDGKLTTITGNLKISLAKWLSITKERRGFLLANSTKPYTAELVKLVLQSSWPKDGSDQDIVDDNKLKLITETLKVPLAKWLSITDGNKRSFLLANETKSYIGDLVMLALQGKWPLDKNGSAILDHGKLETITTKTGLNLSNWTKITSHARRGFLLDFIGTLSDEQIKELALAALSGVWPKNGGDQDISSAADWKKIKDAYPQMSPPYWNGLGMPIRGDALSKSSTDEIKKAVNNAKFRKDKKENAMDKIGEVAGHGATDTVLSSVGLAGSITSLSKGTGDNETLDRAGAGTSAAADARFFLFSILLRSFGTIFVRHFTATS